MSVTPNSTISHSSGSASIASSVPPEIVERIANGLEWKRHLMSFALVCRAWRVPGQYALYQKLRVTLYQVEVARYQKFSAEHPDLAGLVRELEVCKVTFAHLPWIEEIVGFLPRVQHLRIRCARPLGRFRLPREPPKDLVRVLRRVDIIDDAPSHDPAAIVILQHVCVAFAPEHLNLIDVRQVYVDNTYPSSLALKSLNLTGWQTIRMMGDRILCGCTLPFLQSLAIEYHWDYEYTYGAPSKLISRILRHVGAGLCKLSLRLGRLSERSDPWKDLELYHCKSLRTLYLQPQIWRQGQHPHIPGASKNGWQYIEGVLSKVTADLETLSISTDDFYDDQHLPGQLEADEWMSLQQLILSKFHKLKHVVLVKEFYRGWGDYDWPPLSLSERRIVETTMPMLYAAGLIRFEWP